MWPLVSLEELCEINIGRTPSRSKREYWGEGFPWLSIADMNQGPRLFKTKEQITRLASESVMGRAVAPGTVALSFKLSIGKVGIVQRPMYTNEAIATLPVKDTSRLLPEYLAWALRAIDLFVESDDAAMGKTLNKKKLARLQIPVPALAAQMRIVEVLDRVDVMRAKRRQSIALLEDLAQSIFVDTFETSDVKVESVPLGTIAAISSGITKGRKIPASAAVRSVPYLAVANVQDKHLNLDVVKTIEATEAEIGKYRLRSDDLLLTEGGDPDKLGRGTLWRDELGECIHQNHIFRVRLNDNLTVRPIYLNWVIASGRGRRYFLRSAKQTTGIASINATQLRNFPVPIVSISSQQRFEERIEAISVLRQKYDAILDGLDTLFASILSRAFRGELWQDDVKAV